MNKARTIVYYLCKDYRRARDRHTIHLNRCDKNSEFFKFMLNRLETEMIQCWNSLETSRRILYGIEI